MKPKEVEEHVIANFQRDEHMMILVFAQWCINHELDPMEVYLRAYPDQATNPALSQALELTVPKEESEPIPDQTLLNLLSVFGNEDLAFIVTAEIEK
ncbi:hypothetical protein JOD43_001203 [Pullulanibacillus pueri]|uniref:YxiS n=1 Tax=Pullulanibacillus pueri TaxID=1437324 RepID=A0A8J2ZTU3_9BACL|nr:hypothetical protein [Pullulanibacillus pueri]MBM7681036.1 hypothetical protein [Pullulanibacillus pueri]GGH76793.1 hypothetical protein GCM10007096_07730 [Pullulanibacillus pueri]